jgi:molybdopterin molybdotransferase
MTDEDRRHAGFRERTRLAAARDRLLDAVDPHGRTRQAPLGSADGRTLAETVTAPRPVPGYERAAMDGYAVRARDTFGAADRSPAVLRLGAGGDPEAADVVGPEEAARVHTGSPLPDGADAVVMVEHAERVGDEVEVFDAVAGGENVAPVGEDVAAGRTLFEPGHVLRPSDVGLLKAVGVDEVAVRERPTLGVIPTGEELVQGDPDPGEVVETNGLTVSRLGVRWNAAPTYRDVVPDDPSALRAAIQRDLAKDAVVTTGGSSVGARDYVPEVVDDLGEVLVHGVALRPGHPVALGVVAETPVLMLPGYPVACIVNAVQFLRPLVRALADRDPVSPEYPTTRARLSRKISSEPGVRTFARVRLRAAADDRPEGADGQGGDGRKEGSDGHDQDGDDGRRGNDDDRAGGGGPAADTGDPVAEPVRAGGAGVLSSVALADGWVVVPEDREGIPADERVAVENWEWTV